MTIVIEKLRFLGLNDREIRVFTTLSAFGRMNMTKIASRSQLPRTTVDAIVRRLVAQGLVQCEQVRGHQEYLVDTNSVADTLEWIEKRFRGGSADTNTEPTTVPTGASAAVETLRSPLNQKVVSYTRDTFDRATAFEKYRGDRVKLLFSVGQDTNEEMLARFSGYVRDSIRYAFKLEILTSSDIADALLGYEGIPIPNRSGDVRLNVVPASYSTGAHDLFIFRDSALLFNAYTHVVDHIEEKAIVDLSRHLLEIACETGWSVDLTTWLNKEC